MIVSITTVLLVSCYTIAPILSTSDELVIQLKNPPGRIKGYELISHKGKSFYGFKNIPYAAPPIGEYRFKEPQNHKGWKGILDATNSEKVCIQISQNAFIDYTNKTITEDCLVLNVFTPLKIATNTKQLPVLFWIHGGNFINGCGSIYGAKYFMDYDIIVVTINYRLGPFGFLTTNDENIPGNIGLKDQLFALKWVQENIKLFGGNASEVIIVGESAGSASVSYHLLNDKGKNLFRGAIMQSGSSLNSWAYCDDAKINAFAIGQFLNPKFNSTSTKDLLKLLQSSTVSEILAATEAKFKNGSNPWRPVIEDKGYSGAFIASPMHEAFISGNFNKVPILLGYNSEEMLSFLKSIASVSASAITYDLNPSMLLDRNLNVDTINRTLAGKEIKDIYTNTNFVTNVGGLVKFWSDTSFISGIARQAELSSNHVPVYLYQFSYSGGAHTVVCKDLVIPGTEMVGHGEDLLYLWDLGFPLTSPRDLSVGIRLQKLFTNFVKYLNPTPQLDETFNNITWPKCDSQRLKYLNINNTLEIHDQPRNYGRIKSVYNKYIRPPLIVF